VIVLEVARALRAGGVDVSIISQVDGLLRHEFERAGFSVVIMERPVTFWRKWLDRAKASKTGRRKVAAEIMRTARRISEERRFRRMARKIKGPLLVNSFASWPLAIDLLGRHEGPACWYIHESYEPGVMMTFPKSHARLKSLYEEGKVRLLFGADATRALWAQAGLRWRRALLERHPDVAFTGGAPAVDAPQGKRRVILMLDSMALAKAPSICSRLLPWDAATDRSPTTLNSALSDVRRRGGSARPATTSGECTTRPPRVCSSRAHRRALRTRDVFRRGDDLRPGLADGGRSARAPRAMSARCRS